MFADRVKETSTTTGTGTLDLLGAATNFITFVAGIGTGNRCYYSIVHQTLAEWEVGIGTVTDAATDTLSRTTVLGSSNAGALVNFSAGTKDVFVTIPGNDMLAPANMNSTTNNNILVPANTTSQVVRKFTVISGKKLIIQSSAIFKID
jgi:hypothetical protein